VSRQRGVALLAWKRPPHLPARGLQEGLKLPDPQIGKGVVGGTAKELQGYLRASEEQKKSLAKKESSDDLPEGE